MQNVVWVPEVKGLTKWVYVMSLRRPSSWRTYVRPQNFNIDIFSDNMISTVLNLAQWCFVARSFKTCHGEWPPPKVTTMGANGKSWKTRFLRHYDHYSHKTWFKDTLWEGHSDHTTLTDLHPMPRWQRVCVSLALRIICHLICPTTATYRNHYDFYHYVSLNLRINTSTLTGPTSLNHYSVSGTL